MGKSIRVAKGKEVFEIDAQDLPFAAKDGFLPTERIIVANSKTKESFEIDPADYLNAVNDGFEFADLAKKKEPIPSNLPPSPVPSPSPSDANIEQPVTIQQIRELKVPQFEQVIGGSMVAPSQPIQKDNPELKPAIEKYAAQYGLTDRDIETIVEDFDWADDSFVRNLGVMKQRSPEEFYRTIDAYYVRQSLPKEKQAQFNNLQSYGDLQGLQNNMQILWKDLQGNREAQERLLRMNQSYINPSNLDVRVAAQKFNSENRDKIGRDLSRYEYAGLKTLEVFNPELAQSYIKELRTGSEWAGAKKTERNAQLERIALQLETIGRENTIRAAKQTNEVISFYKKQMDAAATPEEKQSVAEMMQADPIVKAAPKIAEELEELQLAESFDDKAYPTLRAIDAVQVYNQTRRKGMSALDVAAAMPIGFVSGLGKYAEGTLNTIDNVIGAVVLGDEDILRRDMLKRGEMTIGTADDKRYGQQSLFSVDANFSKQIESVLADESLTPDEKKAKTIDLIYKNPDKYKLNPNADKFDLNAQTVLLGGSELMGEILGLALLQRGMGAGVNAPKYKNLAATLGSTGVAMYDDFYKQALIRNSKSPALEASLDVAIAWLSETISPDYKIVRKVLGKSNSPVIAGITEETWNAIRSRLPQAAVATIRGLSKAISTAIPESFEEMSGAAMTQAKERGVFGRETAKPDATNAEKAVFGEGINPFIDDVVNAGVTTLATMAVPSTVSLISNAKGVSFEDKSRLYALGVRGEAGLPADMPEKIRKVVTEMQAIVANIKDNYPELNEKQRTEMAFNMYRKKAIQADKATMTEKQKEQADKAIIEADDAIEATVVGEKAVIEQIDGDAKVEADAIDKKIESLNPESEGYKEKKAELKEEKATIKQTAEERKAALKEAVRAAFPQTPTNEPTTTEANQPTAEIEGATNPQQIEAGTPAGVQPSIGAVGQGRPAGNVAVGENGSAIGERISDEQIEKRMSEIEGANFGTTDAAEFNALEKEMEKRERESVFYVPLEKVNDAVDALMKKEKEKPNGYGAFIEKRDARETKEVADRYLNAKKLTDAELKKDFSDALRGNPTTWYADGLKLRESLKEATRRGIDTKEMLAKVARVYTDAGYDAETAKSVVANMLKPIFEGSQKVNEKQIAEQAVPSQPIPQSQAESAGNVAVEQPIPQQGDTVTIISKTDGKPINYFYNGNSWVFTDSKSKEQKVTQKEAEAVTKEWEMAQGAKVKNENDWGIAQMKDSPLKQRILAAKAKYPDAILVFRVKDFYEIIGSDAEQAASVLGLNIAENNEGVSLAGFNKDSVDENFKKLLKSGKRVALVEDVIDEEISNKKTIKQKGKAAADFIRTLRPPSNTAQSNILGLPIAVYDTAIVAIANAVEAGATVAQAIADVVADLQRQFPNWKEANKFATEVEWAGKMRPFISQQVAQFPDLTTEEIMEVIADEAPHLIATPEQEQAVRKLVNKSIEDYAVQEQSAEGVDVRQQAEDGEGMGEGNAEIPPTPPTGEQVGSDEEGPKLRDKGILNRLYNAERIPQQAREAFKDNLKYEPKSQVEAEKIAQGIIAEFGIDEAVLRAEAGTFHGDVNSMIFATALNQLYEQESKAQGDEKVAIAKKFADISMRYDEAARSGGRFISAIGYFYKKSPLGMRMLEEANRNEQFKEWIKSKENDYRAFFEELMKEPEVQEMVEKEVRERLKKERAQKRTERKKKVNDAIDKWINDLGKQTYSSVVPPTVLIPVLKAAKGLYNAGESVLEIVEKAVDSIDEKMNGVDWDRDAFRTKLSGMLDEAESADELKRQRAIEKFRNKLKGLSEEQKDKLIRKSLRKLVADGALEFDDFKKMLADIIGMGEMSPEEIAAFEQTVKDMNAAADVADEIANAETLTPEMMQRYNEARVKAEKAAIAYGDLVYNKPDITKRLLSYLQLAPLGIKALVTNPFYNVWQHVAVRIPTAVVGNVVDTILYRASQVGNSIWGTDVLYPKNDPRNIAEVQKQFFKGGFLGTKKAISQVVTGLTDKDYIQKDMYNSRNKPLVAIRDIFNQLTKKKLMTNKQIFDKMLQGTLGITMEGVARLLNVGDKPMRYAAERAEAARFAKELGLKDLELDFFMELPREIAFREYKKRGMTDEAAGEKADEIVDGIIKSGEKSVFQGDNILATAIDSFFEKFGLTGRIFRVLNLPYVKTPLNSLWSLYNLVNPYVALAQVTFYGGRAVANKSRKDYEESKYWLGHAVSGFALHALMGALVQYGIFSPPDEDDESKREREGRKTYNPNGKVNITKLMAFLDGGDPNAVKNGVIVDIQYFGVMGVLGAMITKKNQEMTEEQRKNGMTFIENQLMNLDITTKHFIDQGIFGQTSLAIEAFQKRGAALDQWLLGMINMGTNVVQPAMYAQISRAQLPYYSRQKADDFKGQVKNSMLSRSSVLRELMGEMPPSKIGVWGDTMSKGGSEFMDVMGRLFGVTRENDDNFAQPIYEDYMKYNDPLFFPPALKPELDGKKLTAQQYDDLQIFVGQQRKELAKPYVNNGATIPFINKKYSELSKEQKLKALEYIYEVGKENGIVLFTQKYKEFQKPFEAPTYESIMEKINNKYMQSFKQMLPKIRN